MVNNKVYSMNCPVCDAAVWLVSKHIFEVSKVDIAPDGKTVTVLLALHPTELVKCELH